MTISCRDNRWCLREVCCNDYYDRLIGLKGSSYDGEDNDDDGDGDEDDDDDDEVGDFGKEEI